MRIPHFSLCLLIVVATHFVAVVVSSSLSVKALHLFNVSFIGNWSESRLAVASFGLVTIVCIASMLAIYGVYRIPFVSKGLSSPWRGRNAFLGILAFMYLATATVGSSAVQTAENRGVVRRYKELLLRKPARVGEKHPHSATYFSIPLAPGILLSYHEFQASSLDGFGGFHVHVWRVVDTRLVWWYTLYGS